MAAIVMHAIMMRTPNKKALPPGFDNKALWGLPSRLQPGSRAPCLLGLRRDRVHVRHTSPRKCSHLPDFSTHALAQH